VATETETVDTAVEQSETEIAMGVVNDALKTVFVGLYALIITGSWVNLDNSDQLKVRETIALLDKLHSGNGTSKMPGFRPAFDKACWEGHDEGKVQLTVESIRARRKEDAEKPGKKTEDKTPDELFEAL
jgi:hypothetical protein